MWEPNRFPNRAVEHRRRLDAEEMLRRWMAGEQATVEHSEVSFEYPLGDAVIRGKIDAIFRNDEPQAAARRLQDRPLGADQGRRPRRTFSSARTSWRCCATRSSAKLGKTGFLQLSYLGAMRGDDGFARVLFTPGEGYEQWAEDTITELVGRIRAESFAPNPAADCRWCDFKPICPLWPEGREAGAMTRPSRSVPTSFRTKARRPRSSPRWARTAGRRPCSSGARSLTTSRRARSSPAPGRARPR